MSFAGRDPRRRGTLRPVTPRPSSSTGERAAGRRNRPRIDLPTFLLHWGLVAALGVSLATGLRIASDDLSSRAGALARRVVGILAEGRVIQAHVVSGWVVTFVAVAYGIFLWRSRLARRVRLRDTDLDILRDASTPHLVGDPQAAWSALNRMLFQLAFLLIGVLCATGWLLLNDAAPGLRRSWVFTAHGLAAWGLVLYLPAHVVAAWKAGRLRRMFNPRARHALAGALAAVVALLAVAATYITDRTLRPTLWVARVDVPPTLTGDASHPAWGSARPVTVRTARGANLPRGESTVEVRALHDGRSVYFAFRWEDPQRSQKMTPLLKTESGWRVLQTALEQNDENAYYEDKFAVILSHRPELASGTVHLGSDLIAGPHYLNPRGLHYTEGDAIVDLWHWKSVRSGGMTPGFADDNYIGPPLPSTVPGARYTGGYTQDPPGAPHPYVQNWVKVDADLPLGESMVLPRFLPKSPDVLERMGEIDLDPAAHDAGVWYLSADDVVPYDESIDQYPLGTVLPGIIIEGPFEGDRADVSAEATWTDGHWMLETRRLLDTGSTYDVAFGTGREVFLWVAVFDRSQIRHSQHLQPVRVVLE